MSSGPSPTAPSDRIVSLDVLRGVALLGILIINIRVFAMPFAVLQNPTAYGDFTGANYIAWLVGHVFAQEKFITLFTLLFGAGIILFTRSKDDASADRLHYRRTAILLGIGLAHAYLLWYGDILVLYALCGLLVVSVRDLEPALLARFGLLLIAVPTLMAVLQGLSVPPGSTLPGWSPSDAELASEIATYRGGWLAQFDHRGPTAFLLQTQGFLSSTLWRLSGLMLLGMGLFKSGILSNRRSTRFYWKLLAGGTVGGLALILTGVWYIDSVDWAARETAYFGTQFNYWGSLLLALAYIAAVMLYCRYRTSGFELTALSAVGRTALSNYLLQTVLATWIFYGHGLGLFGTMSRVELLGVVAGIWAVQILLSVVWLRYFRFGPVEWLWRTGTYGSRQPLRKES
ncbi:uncharacterized protein halTADL_1086 [Halohasta litchfieldiae]|uniref:DUF418 domain-containing protein n=1 Tax=Halohasta litchfieldiae TaxID=1073996 RepID=A0A1H6S8B1_9EURY|nr:DUF418 domain-containing protein [Halohasta litchfieldiae]ATW87879.1 uncharacterized protein halTADL_1086 [Halohasta litchfieldiae]SEI63026.1 uncharacterized protein SAMN05444271_104110 [Halohasta litchfieldiae]